MGAVVNIGTLTDTLTHHEAITHCHKLVAVPLLLAQI